jgi:hypothetical protein
MARLAGVRMSTTATVAAAAMVAPIFRKEPRTELLLRVESDIVKNCTGKWPCDTGSEWRIAGDGVMEG